MQSLKIIPLAFCYLVLALCQISGTSSSSSNSGSNRAPDLDDFRNNLQQFLVERTSGGGQPMRVIGAGLPRTGTASLHRAVSVLGYHTYHMQIALKEVTHTKQWAAFADGTASFQDVAKFISRNGYNATFDYPTSDYVAEYLQLYPDAKVILSVRDNATAWAQSFQVLQELVLTMERPFSWTYPNWIPLLTPERAVDFHKIRCHLGTNTLNVSRCELLFGLGQTLDYLLQHYEKHNARIREIVPPEQLLEFNVKQGWEPLCEFLGHTPPERNFPRVGEARRYHQGTFFCLVTTYLWIPTLVAIILWGFKFCHVRFGAKKQGAQEKEKQS